MSANLTERLSQWKPLSEPQEDLFTHLPQDITRDILRRVPLRSILRCKRVCKSWRDLIEEDEFVTSYTMEPGLVISDQFHGGYVVCDEAHKPLFRFDVPTPRSRSSCMIDSANGLLLVRDRCDDILFTFDPITRDYIELDPLPERGEYIFGFGVSQLSGQYKILFVNLNGSYFVYTHLGRGGGRWRSMSTPPWWSSYHINRNYYQEKNFYDDNAVFFNGNLHWMAFDFLKHPVLCCFDLETELFTNFSLPGDFGGIYQKLCVLGGRLCVCLVSQGDYIVIWLMTKYGDENSWVKEYTFTHSYKLLVCPLKILANGDLVFTMVPIEGWLFTYSKSKNTTVAHSIHQRSSYYSSYDYSFVIYTPSLNLLKLHPMLTSAT